MLSYFVTWHMERAFQDDDHGAAEAQRASSVAPALRSAKALDKTKRTEHEEPVHNFATLLKNLATIGANRISPTVPGFTLVTHADPISALGR
jgi:hypothetical protein